MKDKRGKFLLLFLNLFICVHVSSQGIDFINSNWTAIKNKAKVENKLIFVDVYTTWCGPCKKMDKYVFKTPEVGAFYNTNFIPFKIDAEEGEGLEFVKTYSVNSYPTLLFIDGQGKQIMRNGSMNADEFLEFGAKALKSEKEFRTAQSLYSKGHRNPEFIFKYLTFLKERNQPTEDIASWYLSTVENEKWLSKNNLNLIASYIENPNNVVVEFLVKNKESKSEIAKGNYAIYLVAYNIYKGYIGVIVKNKRDQELDELLSLINSNFYPNERAYLTFLAKKELAKRDADWKTYSEACIAFVNRYRLQDYASLNNWAMAFYKNEHITDKNSLNEALKWVDIALENEKSNYKTPPFLDTKARILYKLGEEKEALKIALKALKMADKNGLDQTPTLELIEEINSNN